MNLTSTDLLTGNILHLQRLSTEDGPGIRTTVFFKGCPLNCIWCHNPESVLIKPQVQWVGVHCISCHTCIAVCPQHGLSTQSDGIHRDRELCTACGSCVDACPSNAMEMLGKKTTPDDLVEELLKDRAYFEKSGGGVTLSGGEPTLQPAFTLELLMQLKLQGIQTAMDTCGLCSQETLADLLPWVDVLLFDLKLADSTQHKALTGVGNERILDNLKWVCDQVVEAFPSVQLWVRTPLIPGATFMHENIAGIGSLLSRHAGNALERWELCAFNNLGRDKYFRLGMEWQFANEPLMTRVQLDEALELAQTSFTYPDRVFVTGSSRVDNLPKECAYDHG
jgi:pyruvate formate lyase activating enzyme